jgi:hypothetical protein
MDGRFYAFVEARIAANPESWAKNNLKHLQSKAFDRNKSPIRIFVQSLYPGVSVVKNYNHYVSAQISPGI